MSRWTMMLLVLAVLLGCGVARAGDGVAPRGDVDRADVQLLQEQMLGDQEIMALIGALRSDPAMMSLLNDPDAVKAVQAGDVPTLLKNEQFMQLLNNPRILEIVDRMERK